MGWTTPKLRRLTMRPSRSLADGMYHHTRTLSRGRLAVHSPFHFRLSFG